MGITAKIAAVAVGEVYSLIGIKYGLLEIVFTY